MLAALCLLLVACGTLSVGIETTPTADARATAEVAALQTENARLATQVAAQLMPTPTSGLDKLAYVQGGDIWVKELPAGQPHRLTTDGRNSEPKWSASGDWLAFRKGEFRQVWLMRADGSDARSLQTGPDGVYAWAPTDDRLAYVDGDALKLANADGTDAITLLAGTSVQPPTPPPAEAQGISRLAWSPDGNQIAFVLYRGEANKPYPPRDYVGIWTVEAKAGSEPVERYAQPSPAEGDLLLTGWTSDGRFILYWFNPMFSASMLADGAPLYALPAEGGAPVPVATSVLAYGDFIAPEPAASARLVAVVGGYRAAWMGKALQLIDLTGRQSIALTGADVAVSSPAWSADGSQVAYVAMRDEGDLVGGEAAHQGLMGRRIWVVKADGAGSPRRITGDMAYRDERPLWSSDGSHILFARLDEQNRASLWLMRADGSEPRKLVEELTPAPEWFGYYGHIQWEALFDWWRGTPGEPAQPQATVVESVGTPTPLATGEAALVYRDSQGLYFQDPAGSEARQIMKLPDGSGHFALSPLGYLAYVLGDTLYLADLSDGGVRSLYSATERTGSDWSLRWSSDGRALAYALAYEEQLPEPARRVELGICDGYWQRVIVTATARSGPAVTSLAPGEAEEGFANLQILGFDRVGGRIMVTPVGGKHRYDGVIIYDVASGLGSNLLSLDDPASILDVSASPDLTRLAVSRAPGQIELYAWPRLKVGQSYTLAAGVHPGPLRWSADGKWLAFLLYEGEQPGLEATPAHGLWLLDIEEMQAFELLSLNSPEAALLSWHPSGKSLLLQWLDALSREWHYQLIDAGSREATEISLREGVSPLGWAQVKRR